MEENARKPIGIFDSGIGGLTVAKAIRQLMPNENLIYYGDTAHLPYGDKSSALITQYSLGIADFMLQQGAKVIMVACNTASATAFYALKKHVGDQALVVNVIDPVVNYLVKLGHTKRVGVIGTKTTIRSGAYEEKLQAQSHLEVLSMATPLLVPMIEEGFIYDDISNAIIRAYLSNSPLKNLDALVLGCTHYPIIKNQIRKFYDFDVHVIDSGAIVSAFLKHILQQHHLLNPSADDGWHKFFVSDYTGMFGKIAKMFFEEDINLEQRNIWQ